MGNSEEMEASLQEFGRMLSVLKSSNFLTERVPAVRICVQDGTALCGSKPDDALRGTCCLSSSTSSAAW